MIESSPVFVDGFGRRVVRVSRDEPPVELLQIDAGAGRTRRLRRCPARAGRQTQQPSPHLLRPHAEGRDRPLGGLTLVSRVRQGVAAGRPARRGRDREPDLRHRRRDAAAAPAAADGGDARRTQNRDTASGALGPEHLLLTPQGRRGAHRLRARLGHRDAGLGSRSPVAVAPGGRAAYGRRRPCRVAARRRRAGRRHDALARGRPPPARRRVPRPSRGAGRQRPPAHAVGGGRAAFRGLAQLADPRPAARTSAASRRLFDARLALEQLLAAETALHRPADGTRPGDVATASG